MIPNQIQNRNNVDSSDTTIIYPILKSVCCLCLTTSKTQFQQYLECIYCLEQQEQIKYILCVH